MENKKIKNAVLKRRIVSLSYKNKLSHIGSCLTAVDIIDEIYSIKKPDEKFILSAGHSHLAHLVVKEKYLEKNKYSDPNLAGNLIKAYGIHCDRQAGCDVSTGSLGHGIGIAVGMALTDRSKDVYCLLSDGECNEGSVMEALRIRSLNNLSNLKVYVNDNGYAAYDKSSDQFLTNLCFTYGVERIETNMNDYPAWLNGQIAHYLHLDKQQYEELMEVLK